MLSATPATFLVDETAPGQIRLVGASSIPETNEGRWEVPCALEFYEDAYGVVPGGTPAVARNGACSRVVLDDFATVKEVRDLLEVARPFSVGARSDGAAPRSLREGRCMKGPLFHSRGWRPMLETTAHVPVALTLTFDPEPGEPGNRGGDGESVPPGRHHKPGACFKP